MKADSVRGHLDLLLLAVVSDGHAHGYAALEEIRRRSDGVFDLPEGSVYPALHRLEKAGLLSSQWSDVNGRRRREYAITRRGRKQFNHERAEFAHLVAAITAVTRGTPWPATT